MYKKIMEEMSKSKNTIQIQTTLDDGPKKKKKGKKLKELYSDYYPGQEENNEVIGEGSTTLAKAPYATLDTPEDQSKFANNIHHGNAKSFEQHLSTKEVDHNGQKMYHHIFGSKEHPEHHRHTISEHKDPSKESAATIIGTHNKGSNTLRIEQSGVNKPYAGKGMGYSLYQHVLNHHGNIVSDHGLSPKSQKVYEKLSKDPKYQSTFGRDNTDQPHIISVKDHAKNNHKSLVNMLHSNSDEKMAASEKSYVSSGSMYKSLYNEINKGEIGRIARGMGLSLAMLHAAQYMSQSSNNPSKTPTLTGKAPQQIERQVPKTTPKPIKTSPKSIKKPEKKM